MVPNKRMVNVSEAKGFASKTVKKNETIWALVAEWTCREQLKKLRAEEEELAKSKQGTVKGESDFEKKGDVGKKNWVLDGIREGASRGQSYRHGKVHSPARISPRKIPWSSLGRSPLEFQKPREIKK